MNTSEARPPARKSWLAIAWRIVRAPLIAYLVVLLAMMFLENSLIYHPAKLPQDSRPPTGLPIEEARFTSGDGTQLHGWYLAHEHPRAVVLFCHGNGGNVTDRADAVRALHDRSGVSVLAFDYRGYGKSEGKPNERGVLADARAARRWLAKKANVPEGQIVLMGESLGGAVAVDLAVDGARALILENTFSSLPDAAAHHFPWVPVRWLMQTRFDSIAKIGSYRGPLLQSHGDRDSIVPLRSAQQLFEAANEPKEFILIPGYDHNDGRSAGYYERLGAFLGGLK